MPPPSRVRKPNSSELASPSLNQSFTNARRRASAATLFAYENGYGFFTAIVYPGTGEEIDVARGFAVPGHYFHVVVEVLNDDLTLDS